MFLAAVRQEKPPQAISITSYSLVAMQRSKPRPSGRTPEGSWQGRDGADRLSYFPSKRNILVGAHALAAPEARTIPH